MVDVFKPWFMLSLIFSICFPKIKTTKNVRFQWLPKGSSALGYNGTALTSLRQARDLWHQTSGHLEPRRETVDFTRRNADFTWFHQQKWWVSSVYLAEIAISEGEMLIVGDINWQNWSVWPDLVKRLALNENIGANIQQFISGWWFGTFSMFPYNMNNNPIWRTPSFFRGVGSTTNQICNIWGVPQMDPQARWMVFMENPKIGVPPFSETPIYLYSIYIPRPSTAEEKMVVLRR